MKVDVYLYATLSKYLPADASNRGATLDVGEKSRIRDVVHHLEIPEKRIKLIFVNGVHARMDTLLAEGDRVGMFPPVGGG